MDPANFLIDCVSDVVAGAVGTSRWLDKTVANGVVAAHGVVADMLNLEKENWWNLIGGSRQERMGIGDTLWSCGLWCADRAHNLLV